jgi:hypothetical protein
VLYREPKLLKPITVPNRDHDDDISVLYREPKLLKQRTRKVAKTIVLIHFSALP